MSYLLDALNKSKGESDSNSQTTPQPVMYHNFQQPDGRNIYKWISIALALVLTLIIGIVLGNQYALLGVPNKTEQAQPIVIQQPIPQAAQQTMQQPTQQLIQQPTVKTAKVIPEPATQAKLEQPEPKSVQQPSKDPAPEQQAQPTEQISQVIATQEEIQEEGIEQQPMVVGYQPERVTGQNNSNEAKDMGLDNISNDLLTKFNQAIKASEGVEADYQSLQQQQTDGELEEYFTRVPQASDLQQQHQAQIPNMSYQTHLYSSDPLQRWVKVNDKTMQEGQWITSEIQIIEIQKQFLILQMGHIRFSLPALTDWHAKN